MNAKQKRLARLAKLEKSKNGELNPKTEEEEVNDAIRMMINVLSEYVNEDSIVRSVSHHGFMYDLHEIPYWGDIWYLGVTPEGSVVAISIDQEDAINQCEMYMRDQVESKEKPKMWDQDVYMPVISYTLQ